MVAAPGYPYTSPPGPLDEADILNHPAELRSVIADLTDGRQRSGTALSGLANKNEVGIAGQSDGGDVSLGDRGQHLLLRLDGKSCCRALGCGAFQF